MLVRKAEQEKMKERFVFIVNAGFSRENARYQVFTLARWHY
jgi:hypothetical protein